MDASEKSDNSLDRFSHHVSSLNELGYAILESCLDREAVEDWTKRVLHAIEHAASQGRLETGTAERTAIYGSRNLLTICPAVTDLIRLPTIANVCKTVLGPHFGIVRGLYFDKPPGTSWALPWHQDLTIAVARPVDNSHDSTFLTQDGFVKPTSKAGVCHVEAPTWLLARMLTIRIHLDAMHASNGPVVVRAGSHRAGKLVQGERPDRDSITTIQCSAGSAMLMRPLVSHSSIASLPDCQDHRRTIHLELSPDMHLPFGYEWHDFIAL